MKNLPWIMEKEEKIWIYIPSDYGFKPESNRPFINNMLIPAIKSVDSRIEIIDPWVIGDKYGADFLKAQKILDPIKRKNELHTIDRQIGQRNRFSIDKSSALVAICNGIEIDSGVVSEIVYGFSKGKPTLVYRDDFRPIGENEGVKVNLQFQYFIEEGKGRFVNSVSQIPFELKEMLKQTRII